MAHPTESPPSKTTRRSALYSIPEALGAVANTVTSFPRAVIQARRDERTNRERIRRMPWTFSGFDPAQCYPPEESLNTSTGNLKMVKMLGVQSYPDEGPGPERREEILREMKRLKPSEELVKEFGLDEAEVMTGYAHERVSLDPRHAEDYYGIEGYDGQSDTFTIWRTRD